MLTKWGESLDIENVLPEYPRPQLVRGSYLNLNGAWEYAVTGDKDTSPEFEGEIIVPFAIESALSGVGRALGADEYLWYRRDIVFPDNFNKGRVILHFGAVDHTARIWVNGEDVGTHMGGYLAFSYDITDFLSDVNTILIRVNDDTDKTWRARGKQKLKPGKLWHSAVSGIWQTVWCESVPMNYIKDIFIAPVFDEGCVDILVDGYGDCVATLCGEEFEFAAGEKTRLPVGEMHPWSPEDPFLYELSVSLDEDQIQSYFAMRKFSVEKDSRGIKRLFLNNHPYYHNGVLDQGYWPDGLYTAPSDEALYYDILKAKELGFNMIRKHVKVEPMRWYYHCDRLGMLVWQDMPNGGDRYSPTVVTAPLLTGVHAKDSSYWRFGRRDERGRIAFTRELRDMVTQLYNCPCVAMWVLFNEGWGQFDAQYNMDEVLKIDTSRPIDHASGWHDQGIGDVKSQHIYYDEYQYKNDKHDRVVVVSEFGGYACNLPENYADGKIFGYKKFTSIGDLRSAILLLYDGQIRPSVRLGLSATVYSQLVDVEQEQSGIISYDRRQLKIEPEVFEKIIRIAPLRD